MRKAAIPKNDPKVWSTQQQTSQSNNRPEIQRLPFNPSKRKRSADQDSEVHDHNKIARMSASTHNSNRPLTTTPAKHQSRSPFANKWPKTALDSPNESLLSLVFEIPILNSPEYRSFDKGTLPRTVMSAMKELKHFQEAMYPRRELKARFIMLQEQVLTKLGSEIAYDTKANALLSDLGQLFNDVNRESRTYWECLSMQTLCCSEYLCKLLLDDLYKHGMLEYNPEPSSIELHTVVIGMYGSLCNKRRKLGEQPDLPLLDTRRWEEYLRCVNEATDKISDSIKRTTSVYRLHQARLEETSFRPLAQVIISGGFQPNGKLSERTTALPEFIFADIEAGLGVMRGQRGQRRGFGSEGVRTLAYVKDEEEEEEGEIRDST